MKNITKPADCSAGQNVTGINEATLDCSTPLSSSSSVKYIEFNATAGITGGNGGLGGVIMYTW